MWIVVGTKHDYVPRSGGLRTDKNCPECKGSRLFLEVVPRKYLTLYGLPVLPIGNGEPVLECSGCHKHFQMSEAHSRAARAAPRAAPSPVESPKQEDRIVVNCPGCKAPSRVPLVLETLRVTCPSCKSKFEV